MEPNLHYLLASGFYTSFCLLAYLQGFVYHQQNQKCTCRRCFDRERAHIAQVRPRFASCRPQLMTRRRIRGLEILS